MTDTNSTNSMYEAFKKSLEETQETETQGTDTASKKKRATVQPLLKTQYIEDLNVFEIGVDEAGRGPLFGRVYSGAVILPKDDSFDHSLMKDSKKFHSRKKINEVAEYIKTHSLAWGVGYSTEQTIDEINILQATQRAMHKAIDTAIQQLVKKQESDTQSELYLLVDGNYFIPYKDPRTKGSYISYTTVEGGDNAYSCIAAASILAKVARDDYIDQLCAENPELEAHYGIASNKGYGAKRHLDGIKEHGITIWHRRSFGICKQY